MAKARKKVSIKKMTSKLVSPLDFKSITASWLKHGLAAKTGEGPSGELYIEAGSSLSPTLKKQLSAHEIKSLEQASGSFFQFVKEDKWVFVQKINFKKSKADLAETLFTCCRNSMGNAYSQVSSVCLANLKILISDNTPELVKGVLLGLDLAAYRYRDRISTSPFPFRPHLEVRVKDRAVNKAVLNEVMALGQGMNLSRHLVNLPPNLLNPTSYAKGLQNLFKNSSSVKVSVWDHARLKKENMGLLLGVGQASEHLPCLVHLRYRPKGSASKKPIALVGKGITFDSGGLDVKPPAFMRWMKKDMGGSAAVAGTLLWAELAGLKKPLDVYLALAENSISDEAFRPGDVLTARSGVTVEIHNTDAEGRLALADALDVAVTQTGKDAPEKVIDVATLTGAIKAGLGADVAGLFSNNAKLRDQLFKSAEVTGDHCWPMPLYRSYWSGMKSPVADFANCTDGFGGAVTAALFLEKFVKDIPWAHLDIYAWNDSASGALREKGGSGQGVLLLSDFLS